MFRRRVLLFVFWLLHCTPDATAHCTCLISGFCNAFPACSCSADYGFVGVALQVCRELAVRMIDWWDPQCRFEENLQCG